MVVLQLSVGEEDAVSSLLAGEHFLLLMLIIAAEGQFSLEGLAVLSEEGHVAGDALPRPRQLLVALLGLLVQSAQLTALLGVLSEAARQSFHASFNLTLPPAAASTPISS